VEGGRSQGVESTAVHELQGDHELMLSSSSSSEGDVLLVGALRRSRLRNVSSSQQELERENARPVMLIDPCITNSCNLRHTTTPQHHTPILHPYPSRLRLSPRRAQIAGPRLRPLLPSTQAVCAAPVASELIHEARDTKNTRPLLRCRTPTAFNLSLHPSISL
jgi:hypothetical protein